MNHGKPFAFKCSCGKTLMGRPAYKRMQEHQAETGHRPEKPSTAAGKGRNKAT